MKNFPKILLLLSMVALYYNSTKAQSLPSPCAAACLDLATSPVALRTPPKTNGIAVCNMTPSDTSVWWSFRPSSTTFNFSFATTGCPCATGGVAGADVVVYSGTDCNNLTKIQCKNGVTGSFTLTNLSPCLSYWIQVGSTNNCQCNVSITYNVNQLLKTLNPITLSGDKVVCKGTKVLITANSIIPCNDLNLYRWSIAQGNGTFNIKSANQAEFTFTKQGKSRICIEKNFALCSPIINKTCYDIEVLDIKQQAESVKLCPEDQPYVIDLRAAVQKANPTFNRDIVPPYYYVKDLAGTKKTVNIDYQITGTNCNNKLPLTYEILAAKKITLPSLLLCDGEQVTLKGKIFTCADAKPVPQNFVYDAPDNYTTQCDTAYTISVQCVKVTPFVSPKVSIVNCTNPSVTLDASKSTAFPPALSTGKGSTGVKTFLWSNGATTPKISVSTSGTYTVTVTYTYKWLSPTGFTTRTCSRSSSVLVLGTKNNTPLTPVPIANKSIPCLGDTTLFYQPTLSGGSYSWSATNATILGATTGDSIKVIWSNNSPKVICSRLTATCGVGNDTCIQIQTSTIVPNKPTVVLDQCIATDKFKFGVLSQGNNIEHHWNVTNGILSKSIGDTVIVIWTSNLNRSICVRAVADCTFSDETCVTHTSRPNNSTHYLNNIQFDVNNSTLQMQIVPNPALDVINIVSNKTIEQFNIFDLNGKMVLQSANPIIDVTMLQNGVYFVKGVTKEKEECTLRLSKL